MRILARVAYYIINTTKCATAACCSTRPPDADDLSSCHIDTLPLTNQRGLRSVGSLRLAIIQWQQVASSGNKWHPVTSSGNRCLLVAVRSHFGLRLGGRNNPDRASNNRILGRRIKGGELLPSWDPAFPFSGGLRPPEPPPVFVIVSDIRDSEIQDRIRVLYSYSYLRGFYGIEADLTTQSNWATLVVMLRDVGRYACCSTHAPDADDLSSCVVY